MACELFLLSSLWFLFVIFWMETISIWLFLCNFYQDRAFYPWGERVFVTDPGHMLHVFISDGLAGRRSAPVPSAVAGEDEHSPRCGVGWEPQVNRSAQPAGGRLAYSQHNAGRSGGTCCPSGLRTQLGSQESSRAVW